MNVFSFGGGVQSTAALVLAARRELRAEVFIFADVGEDSENPDTIAYMREVALPYADRHGVPFVTVRHTYRRQAESAAVPAYTEERWLILYSASTPRFGSWSTT